MNVYVSGQGPLTLAQLGKELSTVPQGHASATIDIKGFKETIKPLNQLCYGSRGCWEIHTNTNVHHYSD